MRTGTGRGFAIMVGTLGVIAALTSCTAAPGHPAGEARPSAAMTAPFRLVIPARSLRAPGCSSAVASAPVLGSVPRVMTKVPLGPFGAVVAPGGRWVFVTDGSGVTVLRADAHGLAPAVVRTVPLPGGGPGPFARRRGFVR
jgi:hypothetical protein